MTITAPFNLLSVPPEIILHIFSYLDLPELASLSQLSPILARLASDPALHRNRIRIIAPSRVNSSLFGRSPHGLPLRPTVGDLVHRGVMRGFGIERRWRMGTYFYSHVSVRQYEAGLVIERTHARSVLTSHLRLHSSIPNALKTLYLSNVLPDVESSSPAVSRSLLPAMHKLKWSLQKDKLARMVRDGTCASIDLVGGSAGGIVGFSRWLESKGRGVVQDGERVRLAICPGVRKMVAYYEDLGS